MNGKGAPPKVYEELIQKLEGDIRMHIRIEQQMRIHIENLQNRIEELERNKDKQDKEYEDEVQEIKKEKRRLNDLLTLREDEIQRIKDSKS